MERTEEDFLARISSSQHQRRDTPTPQQRPHLAFQDPPPSQQQRHNQRVRN